MDRMRFEPTASAKLQPVLVISDGGKMLVHIPPAPFFIARPKTRLSYFIENHVLLRNSM